MKIVIIIVTLFAVLGGILLSRTKPEQAPKPTSSPSVANKSIEISASFIIMTDKITRSFKAEKYHNQSPDVYIEASDPAKVHVTKNGITWDDFFKTLPMKLTEDCLTTGDGETICDGKNGSLKFYLNDIETLNLLDREIKEADRALIKFTSY